MDSYEELDEDVIKRRSKFGLPPGTPVHTGIDRTEEAVIYIYIGMYDCIIDFIARISCTEETVINLRCCSSLTIECRVTRFLTVTELVVVTNAVIGCMND